MLISIPKRDTRKVRVHPIRIVAPCTRLACSTTEIWVPDNSEVGNLPRFRFPPRQFPLHLPLKFFLWQRARFVRPGCTIELCPSLLATFANSTPFVPSHCFWLPHGAPVPTTLNQTIVIELVRLL